MIEKGKIVEKAINMPVRVVFKSNGDTLEGYLVNDVKFCLCDFELLPFDYKNGARCSFNLEDIERLTIIKDNEELW